MIDEGLPLLSHASDRRMRVAAVIVSYFPQEKVFSRLLDGLFGQVDLIVIVDNGSPELFHEVIRARQCASEHLLVLGKNFGIAAAQNRGIEYARKMGATHVVFFDHDSDPMGDLVAKLSECWLRLSGNGVRVGAVGACYIDERQQNPPPFIRVRNFTVERCGSPEDGDAVAVDYVIASGSLVSMDVLDKVGGMTDELFVDYVDIEWGLRAVSCGYQNYGCFSARMKHSLGDEPIVFLGKKIPTHSALRHYYLFRNAVHLYGLRYVPLHWKLVDAWRLVLKFGFYALFARPRWSHCKMMCRGLWHGCIGRMGQLQE